LERRCSAPWSIPGDARETGRNQRSGRKYLRTLQLQLVLQINAQVGKTLRTFASKKNASLTERRYNRDPEAQWI
jgi:hypothetical protein